MKPQIKVLIAIICLSFLCQIKSQTFNLIKHEILSQLSGPRCLDGSPAAMYIDIGQQTDKFLMYFEGGGLCRGDGLNGMLDYCLKRSFTNLGSSKNYPQKINYNYHPLLSPDIKINPNFYNWTRIFVPYCDGSLHQGFRSNAVQYKGSKLYFRGQNNTEAHFNYLDKNFNFFSASQLIISGTSAGAMAVYSWGNYVYKKAINKQNVYLMPDSGIFLTDFVNPWTNKTMNYYTSSLLQIAYSETKLPSDECTQKYPNNILECFKAGNLHDLLYAKTLVIQSTYDAWGLEQILGLQCLTHPFPSSIINCNDEQKVYIQKYKQELSQNILNFTKQQRHGIWAIGCVQHGFVEDGKSYQSPSYISPYPNGVELHEAVSRFLKGQKIFQFDDSTWPANQGCNGLNNWQKRHNLRKKYQYK